MTTSVMKENIKWIAINLNRPNMRDINEKKKREREKVWMQTDQLNAWLRHNREKLRTTTRRTTNAKRNMCFCHPNHMHHFNAFAISQISSPPLFLSLSLPLFYSQTSNLDDVLLPLIHSFAVATTTCVLTLITYVVLSLRLPHIHNINTYIVCR